MGNVFWVLLPGIVQKELYFQPFMQIEPQNLLPDSDQHPNNRSMSSF